MNGDIKRNIPFNSQNGNSRVSRGVERGGLEERYPDHGDGRSDGEGRDPA